MARWALLPACSCQTVSQAAPAWSCTCASLAMVRSSTACLRACKYKKARCFYDTCWQTSSKGTALSLH